MQPTTQILRIEFAPQKERRSTSNKPASSSTSSRSPPSPLASPGYCRMRVIFLARPADPESTTPKGTPCFESVGAAWASVEELELLPLRGQEPRVWLPYVAQGGPVYPLSLLTREGAPLAAGLVGE